MFFFSSRRRHTRLQGDWSSDVCSSDLAHLAGADLLDRRERTDERLLRRSAFALLTRARERASEAPVATADRGAKVDGALEIGRASCRERAWRCGVAAACRAAECGRGGG